MLKLRMRKRLIILASVLLASCAAVLFAAKIVHMAWNGERAGRTVSRWASSSLAGRGGPEQQAMRFGRIDWPLWPALRSLLGGRSMPIEMSDFTLWDPQGHEIMTVGRLQAGLALDALVWRKLRGILPGAASDVELHLSDALVEKVRCRIVPVGDGKMNLMAAFARRPDAPPADESGGLVVTVARSTISDSSLLMRMPGWEARLERLTSQVRQLRYSSFPQEQQPHRPAFTYQIDKIESPAGQVEVKNLRFPIEDFALSKFQAVEEDRQNLHLAGTARSLGAHVQVKGTLLDVYSDERGADMELVGEHGRKLLAMLPSSDMLSGDAAVHMHVSGPLTDATLAGTARGLELRVLGVEATQGSTHYRVHRKVINLSKAHAAVAGGTVDGEATLRLESMTYRVELMPHDLQISKLGKLLPMEILASLAGLVAVKEAESTKDGKPPELVNQLHIKGIDIDLYRSARTSPPRRIVVTKR